MFCLPAPAFAGSESRVVIGPSNQNLHDGANALRAGDAEKGVRLTLLGLAASASNPERVAGYSNLCAGYVILSQFESAIDACNSALELNSRHWHSYNNRALAYLGLKRYDEAERDIEKGRELNPNARTLKNVHAMYLDETDPVSPSITIDDRRRPPRDDPEN